MNLTLFPAKAGRKVGVLIVAGCAGVSSAIGNGPGALLLAAMALLLIWDL